MNCKYMMSFYYLLLKKQWSPQVEVMAVKKKKKKFWKVLNLTVGFVFDSSWLQQASY